MTALNMLAMGRIKSRTATVVAGTTATVILANAASSNSDARISSITVGNNSAASIYIWVELYNGTTSYRFIVATIPARVTLNVLQKSIYLDEGWSVRATASVAGVAEVVVAYDYLGSPIDVVALVVAGGAGGGGNKAIATGYYGGGGGGGGGVAQYSALVIDGRSYTVTVGAGGAGGATTAKGANGSNSVFDTVTSIGGGGGGSSVTFAAVGGSGGGAGGSSTVGYTAAGAAGTALQGNAGGSAVQSSAGGGGGAGAVGATGVISSASGAGGIGKISTVIGSSVYYAGGGGGGAVSSAGFGTGGTGGGGNGGTFTPSAGAAGTVNTGGGGGGGGASTATAAAGGAGGSGIVILAYPNTMPNLVSVAAGLTCNGSAGNITPDTATRPGYKIYKFTAGTGTISW